MSAMMKRISVIQMRAITRKLSTTPPSSLSTTSSPSAVAAVKPASPIAPIPSKPSAPAPSGSTFIQRLSAFFIGAGIGFGVGFYYIFEELNGSNKKFEEYLDRIEDRLRVIEAKK